MEIFCTFQVCAYACVLVYRTPLYVLLFVNKIKMAERKYFFNLGHICDLLYFAVGFAGEQQFFEILTFRFCDYFLISLV